MAPKVWHVRDPRRPRGAVYVGRPSKWGNPYNLRTHSRVGAIKRYDRWLHEQILAGRLDPAELRGRDLTCWCAPQACHGDLLLALANGKRFVALAGR